VSKQSAVERAARAAAEFGDAAGAVDEAAAVVFGVNRTDLRILGTVLDGPLTAGQVAAAVHLSPAAATTAIQRLVARGYLTREPDPEDRRRAVVALTASARELADRIYGPVECRRAGDHRRLPGARPGHAARAGGPDPGAGGPCEPASSGTRPVNTEKSR
jgi:DNA-binding MarR family transcriptional regulator